MLEQKLEAMIKQESDCHDLESVVPGGRTLQLTTKQAAKAENHAIKLKREIT